MFKAKYSLFGASIALSLALTACQSVPADETAKVDSELQEAAAPATPEEVEAANRADPLTRANFWAKEYAKRPDDLEIAITFAESLRKIGSEDRAIDIASKTAIIHPNNADLLMIIGRSMISKQDFVSAAQAFRRAAEFDPSSAAALAALGTSFDRLDRHLDAQAAYEKALRLEPNRTSTLTNYGLSLALDGNLVAAETQLLKAAAQPDADLRVRENLALIQGLQGKYTEMENTSGAHAPNAVVQQNITTLRSMIKPTRNWDALAETAEVGAVPQPTMIKPELPANTETPNTSVTDSIDNTPLAMSDTQPSATTGFSLRGSLDD
jgi:Flp pilus assembly protein TadD